MYTSMSQRVAEHSRKDGRVVDCTALERRHTETPYRGFESLSFRQIPNLIAPCCSEVFSFLACLSRVSRLPQNNYKFQNRG